MPQDVFISYSSEDKAVAEAVCHALEKRNIQCWIAPRDVAPASNYGKAIIEGIEGSRIMVLVLSASSNHSEHVMREVERAVSKAIPILPLRIDNVVLSEEMEYFISVKQWLDAATPPVEQHFSKLGDTVQALLASPYQPPSHLPPPPPPDVAAGQRRQSRLVPGLIALMLILVAALILSIWRPWVKTAIKTDTAAPTASPVLPTKTTREPSPEPTTRPQQPTAQAATTPPAAFQAPATLTSPPKTTDVKGSTPLPIPTLENFSHDEFRLVTVTGERTIQSQCFSLSHDLLQDPNVEEWIYRWLELQHELPVKVTESVYQLVPLCGVWQISRTEVTQPFTIVLEDGREFVWKVDSHMAHQRIWDQGNDFQNWYHVSDMLSLTLTGVGYSVGWDRWQPPELKTRWQLTLPESSPAAGVDVNLARLVKVVLIPGGQGCDWQPYTHGFESFYVKLDDTGTTQHVVLQDPVKIVFKQDGQDVHVTLQSQTGGSQIGGSISGMLTTDQDSSTCGFVGIHVTDEDGRSIAVKGIDFTLEKVE